MCGIAGGFTRRGISVVALDAALDAMRHRGPDDRGIYTDQSIALGMRRLAIIDVSNGHQPIFNEDGSVVVVLNGEIYNYVELMRDLTARGHRFRTASDTETLVHLYEEYGPEMCSRLRGMFAFAIWDKRQQRLFIGRDRFGKKPLYFARTADGGVVFASELKSLRPLLAEVGIREEIDPQAIYDYLSLGSVPQPATIYRQVECLPAGSWLSVAPTGIRQEFYWRLEDAVSVSELSYSEAKERTRELVADAVRVRLRSDVPLGVFLSGGLDSSVVAYEAAKVIGPELRTFTVAMPDRRLDESAVAGRTAEALGIRNDVLTLDVIPARDLMTLVRHFDQPYADSSAIPSLAVSRLARQHVTVVLNGDGGDEVFAGYRRYVASAWHNTFRLLPQFVTATAAYGLQKLPVRRRSLTGFAGRFLRGLSHSTGERYLHWTTDLLKEDLKRTLWKGESQRSTEAWLGSLAAGKFSSLKQQMLLDARVNLLSDLLVKMDMATMAASLEGRSPLMDHHLAEFALSQPDRFLVRGNRTKCLLRDAYAGLLPDEVIRGAKRGFEVPLRGWLTHDLRPMLFDLLSRPNACVRSWIDGEFIAALLNNPPANNFNWDALVYSLLVLELWLEQHSVGNQQITSERLVA
jgi:asparagine synthase (glutamine-hydrolysing)